MNAPNTNDSIDTTISSIDAAIAKAKEKRAARAAGQSESSTTRSKEEREQARQAAAAQRAAARLLKRSLKAQKASKPAHMTKVEKAGARLPALGDAAKSTFEEVTQNLSSEQITALALHLQHFNRVQATTRALTTGELKVGQIVRITGGDPKYIGMVGIVETLRRIRAFVIVQGFKKPIYLFTSECEPVSEGQSIPTAEVNAVAAAV